MGRDNRVSRRHHISNRWPRTDFLEASWNVMAHAQKPYFVFRRNGTSPFKSAGWRQFSRLLAAEVCASAVVMLDTPCSEVVWRVLATHYIRQFPLHFPSRASPCAITFQLLSTRLHVPPLSNRQQKIFACRPCCCLTFYHLISLIKVSRLRSACHFRIII